MNPADGPYAAGQAAMTALGRFGTADEDDLTVAHLAGASYVTGAEFSVDGGRA
ncbi:3-oxoacyl-[acyl-carrier-protein] reductase OS=Streptomyces glaucescens OX=1907 GN=SGLAU_26835 PE=3 SV=1 [Streptomyces glaucescens]